MTGGPSGWDEVTARPFRWTSFLYILPGFVEGELAAAKAPWLKRVWKPPCRAEGSPSSGIPFSGQPFLLEVLRPHTYPAVFEECSTPSGLAGTPEVGSPGPSICSRTGEAPPGWSGADPIPVLGRGPWRERMCLVTPISVLEGVTSLQTLGLAGGGGLPLSRERVTFPKSHLSAKSKRGMWREDKTYRGTAGPVQAPTIVRWVGGSGKLPRRGVASASPSVRWDHERGTSCGRGPRRPSV